MNVRGLIRQRVAQLVGRRTRLVGERAEAYRAQEATKQQYLQVADIQKHQGLDPV